MYLLLEIIDRLTILQSAVFTFGLWAVYKLLRAIYNITLHPLAGFPGPVLAGASYWYEGYFDLILWGRYTSEIARMHEKYGPIVRINPDELHCSDPHFIDEIFAIGTRKRNKPAHQLRSLGDATFSGFGTADHNLHKLRRAPLTKFFSKLQITKLEPEIHKAVHLLCDKLLRFADKKEPFDLTSAYSCFTSDVIAEYCFGENLGFLQQDGIEPNFRRAIFSVLNTTYVFRFIPWLKTLASTVPYMAKYLSEDVRMLEETLNITIPTWIKETKAEMDAGIVRERETIFASLFRSNLPDEEKTIARFAGETMSLFGAGTETTSWTLAVITYYLLTQPEILKKLTEELRTVVDDPKSLPPWSTLEQLPYLNAVMTEGLRLSYGVSGRTARIATEEDLVYHGTWTPKGSKASITLDYVVPRGMAIGMTSVIMHHDEDIFPNSHSFIPERWLVKGKQRRDMERSFFAFGKGSRQCLGMNLAYCELYLALTALIFRVYPHMQLYETTVEDVTYDHDLLVPVAKGNGVKVVIT
ncbi:cytochrome P450 [Trichoderma sp. SZMC 28012]